MAEGELRPDPSARGPLASIPADSGQIEDVSVKVVLVTVRIVAGAQTIRDASTQNACRHSQRMLKEMQSSTRGSNLTVFLDGRPPANLIMERPYKRPS